MTWRTLAKLCSLVTVLFGLYAVNASTASARAERDGTHLIAYVLPGAAVALRDGPFGRVVGRVGSTTPFGSSRALGVIASRGGRWLGVTEAGFGHNRLVWVDAEDGGLQFVRTRIDLEADISTRSLVVRRNGMAMRGYGWASAAPARPPPPGGSP
jgi:hypothetical protein